MANPPNNFLFLNVLVVFTATLSSISHELITWSHSLNAHLTLEHEKWQEVIY